MTRICEKFIESLSSGSISLTDELRTHLLVCPDCQQSLAAVKLLQQQRLPVTAREATAIAGIFKGIQTKTTAATAATVVQAGSSLILASKAFLALLVALVIFWTGYVMVNNQENKEIPSSQTALPMGNTQPAIASTSVPQAQATLAEPAESTLPASAAAVTIASITTQPCSDQENENPDKPQTFMVSPDQEEVDLR